MYWIGWCEKTKHKQNKCTNRFIAYYERILRIYIGGDEGEDDK